MSIGNDFSVDYSHKVIKHASGTTVYTMNEFYSFVSSLFDEQTNLTQDVPISAQTPTDYTLINGWFIPDDTFRYLKGGSISTQGWSNSIYTIKLNPNTFIPFNPTDIGKTVTDSVHTGVLVDYSNDRYKVWIRGSGGQTWSGTLTGAIGSGTITAAYTGESLFSNVYTLGLLELTTTNTVYVRQVNPDYPYGLYTQYWGTGHIDLVIKVIESGQVIDSGNVTVFCREYGDLYADYTVNLSSGGRNPAPLGTFADSNNTTPLGTVASWFDLSVTFGTITRDLGNGNGMVPFDVEIDCGHRTSIQQVYEYLKYITSRTSPVVLNAAPGYFYQKCQPSYAEDTTSPFGTFAGGDFFGARGVYLKNIPAVDIAHVALTDSTGTKQTFPFVSAGEFVFGVNLSTDPTATYSMFFNQLANGNNFGTGKAILVKDHSDVYISGNIFGQSTLPWSFPYETCAQVEVLWTANTTYVTGDEYKYSNKWYRVVIPYTSGLTFGAIDLNNVVVLDGITDGPTVVVVSIGSAVGQYISTTINLLKQSNITINLTAALERNYIK